MFIFDYLIKQFLKYMNEEPIILLYSMHPWVRPLVIRCLRLQFLSTLVQNPRELVPELEQRPPTVVKNIKSQSEFQALDNLGRPLVANLFCVRYLTLTNSKPTSLIQSNRCQSFEFRQLKLSVPESRGTICKRRGKSLLM